MSDINVSSLRFDPLYFDSTLNAHFYGTDTDCNIDNVMTCDCSYFDSDTLNQHIENTNCNLSLYHFNARSLNKHANDITNHLATLNFHFNIYGFGGFTETWFRDMTILILLILKGTQL